MKRVLFAVFASVFLFSCQVDELEFSCDPVINSFVVENMAELSKISTQELTSYETPLQKAVFRSWSPERKRQAWLEKFQYVLDHQSFSEDERKHIFKLVNHIVEGYFEDQLKPEGKLIRNNFSKDWLDVATNDLGWDDRFISFCVYRLYVDQSQFETEVSSLKSTSLSMSANSESGTCNCNISNDFCSGGNCASSGCAASSSGCGWLWSEGCNGLCN